MSRKTKDGMRANAGGRRGPAPSLEDLFAESPETKLKLCDHPGCVNEGLYRAPRDHDLKTYYWFCLGHVQAYNKSWNYYEGMNEAAIEDEIRKSAVWDRPTWPLGEKGPNHARGEGAFAVNDPFRFVDREFAPKGASGGDRRGKTPVERRMDGPRAKAMRVLDLEGPLTMDGLKSRYKTLVKRYHPDVNGGATDAEERFKMVNEAYRVLVKDLKG